MTEEKLPLLHVSYTLHNCDMVPHFFTKTMRWDAALDSKEALGDLEKFLLLTTTHNSELSAGPYSSASIDNWQRLEQ